MAQQERLEQTEKQDKMGLKAPLALQERTDQQGNAGQWDPQAPKDLQETTERQERMEIMAQQERLEKTENQD